MIVCPIGVPVGSRLGGKSQADSHHLLKGPEAEDHTLYASHTVWKSRATFEAWTKSEAFRAHYKAGDNKTLYLGHPQFEGFEIIQAVGGGKGMVAGSPR
jgi:heme-degrading monooxygenase HmoA